MEVWGILVAMKAVTEIITQQGLANRFIKASQLDQLIDGSPKRRYGLVNRALKSGELLRIQRGLYVLAERYRPSPVHPFALAQALAPGSYISFETALAFHGWIPERVHTTASVVRGRKSRQYEHAKLGSYSFHSLAIQPGSFLELVTRIQVDEQVMLVAQPCRALMDLICLRKINWQGINWFSDGLRIDMDMLRTITQREIHTLELIYKHKQVKSFISSLSLELNLD
jgi:predicted transcriptional regulator of viral defense system